MFNMFSDFQPELNIKIANILGYKSTTIKPLETDNVNDLFNNLKTVNY